MHESTLDDLLNQSATLHDHLCPKQVLGVRMGMHAAELLGLALPQCDKRLLTIVETDGCFADGVAVSSGCWLGRRTMRCVDYGKIAATFIDTLSGEAVRLHPSSVSRERASHYAPSAQSRWHAYLEGYQVMPAEDLLVAERVVPTFSVEQLVSSPDRKALCDVCHEEIINGRGIVSDASVVCHGCVSGSYVTRPGQSMRSYLEGVAIER
ncbi:MAG: FmdE family protein [Thermomicrobiales bacterium]